MKYSEDLICVGVMGQFIQRLLQSEMISGMLIQFAFLMRVDNVLFVRVFKGHSFCEQLFGVFWFS